MSFTICSLSLEVCDLRDYHQVPRIVLAKFDVKLNLLINVSRMTLFSYVSRMKRVSSGVSDIKGMMCDHRYLKLVVIIPTICTHYNTPAYITSREIYHLHIDLDTQQSFSGLIFRLLKQGLVGGGGLTGML